MIFIFRSSKGLILFTTLSLSNGDIESKYFCTQIILRWQDCRVSVERVGVEGSYKVTLKRLNANER